MTLMSIGEPSTEKWEEPDHGAGTYRATDGVVLPFEAYEVSTLRYGGSSGAVILTHHGTCDLTEVYSR